MAYFATKAYYISSAKYATVTAWATGVAKTVGNLVRQTAPAVNNERVFICIAAGTTAATEPTWNLSKGVKTTETAGPVWMECTGMPALNGDLVNTATWLNVKNVTADLGMIIKDAAGTHIFICTTNGTTGNGAEPTWNTSAVGNTTTDNGATWMYIGTSFTNWGAAFARIHEAQIFAATGDITQYFVGHDAAETQPSSMNMQNGTSQVQGATGSGNNGPVSVMCVNTAGSVPPVTADLSTTGVIAVSGTSSMTLSFGYLRYCYGITFNCGTGPLSISLDVGGGELRDKFYENCVFALPSGTGTGATIRASSGSSGRIRIRNSAFKFNDVGQIFTAGGTVILENCTFDTGAAVPSRFLQNIPDGSYVQIIGCDLSGFGTNPLVYTGGGGEAWTTDFVDCKLPSVPSFGDATLFNNCTSLRVNYTRCDNGSATYKNAAVDRSGKFTTSSAIVRTGGAGDGTTAFSWKVETSVNALGPSQPFDLPKIANDNATTGSTVNVTMYGIANAAALPTNDDVYAEVQYLGTSGNPQATFKSSKRANFLGTTATTNLTADTSAWDTAATARVNTHAYVVGDIISASSNAGRIFFCTTAGTSAGSLPGGYATAVDGGSVTDGTAVFRAGVRFSFTIALSSPNPARTGPIYTTVSFGSPSKTFFVDPALVLS